MCIITWADYRFYYKTLYSLWSQCLGLSNGVRLLLTSYSYSPTFTAVKAKRVSYYSLESYAFVGVRNFIGKIKTRCKFVFAPTILSVCVKSVTRGF